jgi:hydroxymethylpyrimidine/phosphomethylpyrimidine kinase
VVVRRRVAVVASAVSVTTDKYYPVVSPGMTRRAAPTTLPVGLTIAGSDSGGGAGLQADLGTMAANGVFGTSVVTAVTAQNTRGVDASHVLPVEEVRAQYRAVVDDFDVRAAKTGMLATAAVVSAVTDELSGTDFPVVVDPVMVAESGDRLLAEAAEAAYEGLIARADLVTPNAAEAAVLTGVAVDAPADAEAAGERLLDLGANAALVTGGHVGGDEVVDTLVTEAGTTRFAHPRVDAGGTHGSGCTLSSAVAARLARGDDLPAAVETACTSLERAVRYAVDVGGGARPVHGAAGLRNGAGLADAAEDVAATVDAFVERDVSPLVPEVGMNVVGAAPYAESVDEVAALDGRLRRTVDGVARARGVRAGASSHVARFLLAAREFDPSLRFAANCRYDDRIDGALESLRWSVARYDRRDQPDAVREEEGSTMGWGAERAFAGRSDPPVAVADPGDVGKEPMVRLVAEDAETLRERAFELLDVL